MGYDGWPLLGDSTLAPGETRQLGFVFLSGDEAVAQFRNSGVFYLWEGGFIGEAKIVEGATSPQRSITPIFRMVHLQATPVPF